MSDDTLPAALQEALDAPAEWTKFRDDLSGAQCDRIDRARVMAAALRWAIDEHWDDVGQIVDAIAALERTTGEGA